VKFATRLKAKRALKFLVTPWTAHRTSRGVRWRSEPEEARLFKFETARFR